jgi:hypothetical protein
MTELEERVYFNNKINNALILNPSFPNCLVNNKLIYDEQIMSMPTIINNTVINDISTNIQHNLYIKGTFFFFIFNLDNYYHFIYDTIPYLLHYFELNDRSISILIPEKHKLLQFHNDIFLLLNITNIVRAQNNCIYEYLYIPSSLTHGRNYMNMILSNTLPSTKAFDIWNKLKITALYKQPISTPKKIYISRRTWKHNNLTNIGTNYTTRRKCINEDNVVELLEKYGYFEIFCENISMTDKINLFSNASHIVGFIGGGLVNLLFSNPNTIVGCILTPDFLNINKRFSYSMNHTKISYLDITEHISYNGPYSLYTRVKIIDPYSKFYNKIGEIEENIDNKYKIKILEESQAGFAFNSNYITDLFEYNQIKNIDNGLNSPFNCSIDYLRNYLETIHNIK